MILTGSSDAIGVQQRGLEYARIAGRHEGDDPKRREPFVAGTIGGAALAIVIKMARTLLGMERRKLMPKQSMIADVVDGAIAGAVATWLMGKVTTYLYDNEKKAAREREDRVRAGKTAYGVAAEKAASLIGTALSEDEQRRFGQAIHWALGVGAGALYGALRPRVESASIARGLLFGTAFWLLMDETMTPALGLTPGPQAFPWQTHARGLAGHLTFGAVADAALGALQPGIA